MYSLYPQRISAKCSRPGISMTVTRLGASSPQIPQAVPDPVPTRGSSLLRKSLLFGTKKGSRLQPLPHAAHQAHLQRTSRSLIVQAGPGGYGNGAVEPLNVVFVSAEVCSTACSWPRMHDAFGRTIGVRKLLWMIPPSPCTMLLHQLSSWSPWSSQPSPGRPEACSQAV